MDLTGRLREGDRARYLCTLFAAEHHRADLSALYNFNLEIARIRDSVSDPMIGQLRMKWWYDAIDRISGGLPPSHPVLRALQQTVTRHDLDPGRLSRLVETRAADISPAQPDDLDDLFAYVDATAGVVGRMALLILAPGASGEVVRALDLVSRGWGLSGMLRALPAHAARGWHYMPKDRLASFDLTPTALTQIRYGTPSPQNVRDLAMDLVGEAASALAEARRLVGDCPKAALPGLLLARVADDNLARLRKHGGDPAMARPDPAEPGPGVMLKLWWAARRRRF